MGARAQVYIESEGVYLYTHWGAGEIESLVNRVMETPKAKNRRNDGEYLARIIFCEMIKDDIDGETGYGIGTIMHGDIELLVTIPEDSSKDVHVQIFY